MLTFASSVVCVFKSSETMAVISDTSAEWPDGNKKSTLCVMDKNFL